MVRKIAFYPELPQKGTKVLTYGPYFTLKQPRTIGYLILCPHKSVRVLIGWFGIVALPTFLVIGAWMLMQLFSGVGEIVNTTVQTRDGGGVAYWAHIAVAGLLLVCLFGNRDIKPRAWERAHTPPGGPFFQN